MVYNNNMVDGLMIVNLAVSIARIIQYAK